jgi:hypothetical protein
MADERRGRPTLYTPEIAAEILDRFAEGESLASICRGEKMPAPRTVRGWRYDNVDGFSPRYTRARAMHVDSKIDELLEISDNGSNDWMERNAGDNRGWVENGEAIGRSRLRTENRKWLAARILKEEYGDRTSLELGGPDGGPVKFETVRRVIVDPKAE